ncbi:MAG: DUF2282 domain-containing protein [Gammaproteobacteria bacterium]|nr:DUF2282 domain-containing protein [Gammaproteobacteria bacterium]
MKTHSALIKSAIATALAVGLGTASTGVFADKMDMEKCYGVVKAGKNDCKTATNACQGQAAKDYEPTAFIALPKGTCEKIAGSSLKPKA